MSTPTPQEAADILIGTCTNSLNDVVGNEDALTDEWRKEFDALCVECNSCNWWVDTYETDDNGDCEGCQSDGDED